MPPTKNLLVPPASGTSAATEEPEVAGREPIRERTNSVRHSTTNKEEKEGVRAKLGAMMLGGPPPKIPGIRPIGPVAPQQQQQQAIANRKTVQELLAMMAAGNLNGVNEYLNSLGKQERAEVRNQLSQLMAEVAAE